MTVGSGAAVAVGGAVAIAVGSGVAVATGMGAGAAVAVGDAGPPLEPLGVGSSSAPQAIPNVKAADIITVSMMARTRSALMNRIRSSPGSVVYQLKQTRERRDARPCADVVTRHNAFVGLEGVVKFGRCGVGPGAQVHST